MTFWSYDTIGANTAPHGVNSIINSRCNITPMAFSMALMQTPVLAPATKVIKYL